MGIGSPLVSASSTAVLNRPDRDAKPGRPLATATGFDSVKFRAEVRFLVGSAALLTALVFPVSAAVIDNAAGTPAVDMGAPAAGGTFLVHGAPPPLLLMALGALVVIVPVTRRARRAAVQVDPTQR